MKVACSDIVFLKGWDLSTSEMRPNSRSHCAGAVIVAQAEADTFSCRFLPADMCRSEGVVVRINFWFGCKSSG